MGTGIFFELLWLDSIPVGTYIPPQRIFPFFLILAMNDTIPLSNPKIFYLLLLIVLPFAHIGKWLERLHRIAQTRDYDKITEKITTDPSYHLGYRHVKSILLFLLLNITVFFVSYIIVLKVMTLLHRYVPLSTGREINWPLLWTISFIGGILSLKIKKSYLTFVVCYIVLGIFLINFT